MRLRILIAAFVTIILNAFVTLAYAIPCDAARAEYDALLAGNPKTVLERLVYDFFPSNDGVQGIWGACVTGTEGYSLTEKQQVEVETTRVYCRERRHAYYAVLPLGFDFRSSPLTAEEHRRFRSALDRLGNAADVYRRYYEYVGVTLARPKNRSERACFTKSDRLRAIRLEEQRVFRSPIDESAFELLQRKANRSWWFYWNEGAHLNLAIGELFTAYYDLDPLRVGYVGAVNALIAVCRNTMKGVYPAMALERVRPYLRSIPARYLPLFEAIDHPKPRTRDNNHLRCPMQGLAVEYLPVPP